MRALWHCVIGDCEDAFQQFGAPLFQLRLDGIRKPRMFGFQAAGAAPIVLGHPVEHPETVATAIRIGDPYSKAGALAARDESGGAIAAVSDAEIVAAYRFLAREEGVFCEPASAAGVAGTGRDGRITKGDVFGAATAPGWRAKMVW